MSDIKRVNYNFVVIIIRLKRTWLYQTTGKYQSLVPFEEDEAMLLEKAWTELLKSREETSQVKTAYKILDHLELRETLKVTPIIQMNACTSACVYQFFMSV